MISSSHVRLVFVFLFLYPSFPFSLKKGWKKGPITRTNLYITIALPSRLPAVPSPPDSLWFVCFPCILWEPGWSRIPAMIQVEQNPRAGWRVLTLLHKLYFSVLARNITRNSWHSRRTFLLSPLDWINSKASFCQMFCDSKKEKKKIHCAHFSFLKVWKEMRKKLVLFMFL